MEKWKENERREGMGEKRKERQKENKNRNWRREMRVS